MHLFDYGEAELRHSRSMDLKNCEQNIRKLPKSGRARLLTCYLMLKGNIMEGKKQDDTGETLYSNNLQGHERWVVHRSVKSG